MIADDGAGERPTATLRAPAPSLALDDALAKLAVGLNRVKVSVARGWPLNGLVLRMLVMVPLGEVFELFSEKPLPSSVPAS